METAERWAGCRRSAKLCDARPRERITDEPRGGREAPKQARAGRELEAEIFLCRRAV
jgi:hypothetical protein